MGLGLLLFALVAAIFHLVAVSSTHIPGNTYYIEEDQ